jgi:1-acyl-sn-glycerol-3-phosphate acyltransferase
MVKIKNASKFLFACWFGFWTLIGFIILYPGFLITLSNPKWYSQAHKLRRFWGRWLFFWGAIFVKQIIEEPFDDKKPYVIAPNHTSQLDIVTLSVKLRLDFNFMAKIELERIPVFGIFFRTIDIAVDRKNARQSAMAYQKAKDHLDTGKSIVIFPEGTIHRDVPKLGRFKDGAFKLAIEKQADILPVTIIGNWIVLPDQGKFHFRPGSVTQYVHKPISTVGMTVDQIDELKKQVYTIIESKLAEYGYFQ